MRDQPRQEGATKGSDGQRRIRNMPCYRGQCGADPIDQEYLGGLPILRSSWAGGTTLAVGGAPVTFPNADNSISPERSFSQVHLRKRWMDESLELCSPRDRRCVTDGTGDRGTQLGEV